MTKICKITGKKTIKGNNRSHAMNATRRTFSPNIHYHKFWIEKKKKFITLRISTKGMRLINKKGIENINLHNYK
ncbi:50S ribosomal protein L28 [Enterobacteriaceae endosymbiont of Donacia semicuprea]|uniref:50S ribosomal protein L28 n=1 Tax=Enterobacteriaceae endosymbiont of Donacia semicuprea TaxID=2675783 RepID=UPI0014495E7C|nr:50S ribosomal protein L28 [Enterobacteriaceae endosymbiont of Donacia semicuprea]QJC33036.1 50S ribosomal protein L28 [Enterobacteriaceae endosymbiont of Donacia semicuprea]